MKEETLLPKETTQPKETGPEEPPVEQATNKTPEIETLQGSITRTIKSFL